MKLQPLRIEAGWLIKYNQFYEVNPLSGFEDYFEGSSLLMLVNTSRLKLIDVEWYPERDLNGKYKVRVLNFIENFNQKTNEFDIEPNWEHPFLVFTTKLRSELVEKLEELMRTLPVFKDPRITTKRGIVDEPSDSYRLELQRIGISKPLVKNIIQTGNYKIQNLLLDHKEVTKDIIQKLVSNGISQKVKNKALQKLKSKKFKE